MGFVCTTCHGAYYRKALHVSLSRGPCEDCGEVGDCYDCRCTAIRPIPPRITCPACELPAPVRKDETGAWVMRDHVRGGTRCPGSGVCSPNRIETRDRHPRKDAMALATALGGRATDILVPLATGHHEVVGRCLVDIVATAHALAAELGLPPGTLGDPPRDAPELGSKG